MIMDDAKLDLAVEGCLWGGFGTSGQRCTAASRVVVHERVYPAFLNEFCDRTAKLRVGDGLDPKMQMGPVVSQAQLDTVMKYVAIGKKDGARLVAGGQPMRDGKHAKGFYHQPTIFGDVDPKMHIAQEEIFGPVVSVIPCKSFEEAIEIGNNVRRRRRRFTRTSTGVRGDARDGHGILRERADDGAVHRRSAARRRLGTAKRGRRRSTCSQEIRVRRLQRPPPARADRHG
jgi:acyl-CoA reductase-like NAD-dependent aldehyde dehydrogenase